MLVFLSVFLSYIDIAVDTKGRVLLLSTTEPRVEALNDSSSIILDSIFYPTSLTAGPFSIWVAARSQNLIQKYSLWGEYLGSISRNAKDLDADRKGLLIAGEYSFLIELSTGREIPLSFRETNCCALDDDSIYLYGDDTLYIFERNNRHLIRKEYILGIRDISISRGELVFIQGDSIFMSDTTIFMPHARRLDASEDRIWILTDSVYSISPRRK